MPDVAEWRAALDGTHDLERGDLARRSRRRRQPSCGNSSGISPTELPTTISAAHALRIARVSHDPLWVTM